MKSSEKHNNNDDVCPLSKHDRELIIHDYLMCHAGYTSRDQLVAQEFFQLLQTFIFFSSLTSAVRVLQPFNEKLTFFVIALLLISGSCALIAYLVNIEGKASSKKALRERMVQIEKKLKSDEFCYWRAIAKRKKYPAEKLIKNMHDGDDRWEVGSASKYFVVASYIIIIVWVILGFLLIFFEKFIPISPIT